MNRLPRHRFRQALQAGLPVRPRSQPPQDAAPPTDSLVWVLTFDAEGHCLSQELRPAASAGEPQGEVRGESYGYTARDRDADTTLQYHRARSYDPTPGRWLSQDPVAFAAEDANLYRYVATNPPPAAPATPPRDEPE